MAIDSTKLLVAVKAYARGNALPLDSSEVQESLEAAQTYLKDTETSKSVAYPGQTLKVLNNGKYETYVVNGTAGAYTLDKVGVDASAVKNYVQVLDELPATDDAEQGVIYIVGKKGYIFNGTDFKTIFEDVTTDDGKSLADQLKALDDKFADYAPLAGATFTGEVVLAADPTKDLGAATKQYVDRLIANLQSSAPGVVDADNPLPDTGYKAGAMWRVAAAGTYAGQECEVGDLIIAVTDPYAGEGKVFYATVNVGSDTDVQKTDITIPEGSTIAVGDTIYDSVGDRYKVTSVADDTVHVSDAEGKVSDGFIVVQANVDGAVSGPDASTDANIAVFDGTSGKKLADSTVTIASVKDAVAKAHEHANKTQLDSYDKTQTELLEAAAADAAAKVKVVSDALADKADAENVYTKADVDAKVKTLTDNLNTKLDVDGVKAQINTRLGDIDENTTVKEYVDQAVAGGGTDVADEIAAAKADAIKQSNAYTDTALTITEF